MDSIFLTLLIIIAVHLGLLLLLTMVVGVVVVFAALRDWSKMNEESYDGLFGALDPDQAKRLKLRAKGWRREPPLRNGQPAWRRPDDNAILSEADAFAYLRRLEAIEQSEGKAPAQPS